MSGGSIRVHYKTARSRGNGLTRLAAAALIGLACGMALAALFGLANKEFHAARAFGMVAVCCLVLAGAVIVLLRDRAPDTARAALSLLLLVLVLAPLLAALPVAALTPGADFSAAYFEMASAFTTTGASAIADPAMLPRSVLFWRALCAGMGGFIWLVAALTILKPLSIGGFEVTHMIERDAISSERPAPFASETARRPGLAARAFSSANLLAAPYCGAVLLIALLLTAAEIPAFDALCLALGAVSTTGFTTIRTGLAGFDAPLAEMVLLAVMIFAALGVGSHAAALRGRPRAYRDDPELRYMLIAVAFVVALLFLRHWIGAFETSSTDELSTGLEALWGAVFMAVSFITTTGLESASWGAASDWSGLDTPGVALMGLAIVGGGAASTAGGVKLIRAALLAKHSRSELRRLGRPSTVTSVRSGGAKVSSDALRMVWVFVMLYLLALAACALGLTALNIALIDAIPAAVAAISNTGPLAPMMADDPLIYAALPPEARYLLCAGMVIGRMETLAVVALMSPSAWRL